MSSTTVDLNADPQVKKLYKDFGRVLDYIPGDVPEIREKMGTQDAEEIFKFSVYLGVIYSFWKKSNLKEPINLTELKKYLLCYKSDLNRFKYWGTKIQDPEVVKSWKNILSHFSFFEVEPLNIWCPSGRKESQEGNEIKETKESNDSHETKETKESKESKEDDFLSYEKIDDLFDPDEYLYGIDSHVDDYRVHCNLHALRDYFKWVPKQQSDNSSDTDSSEQQHNQSASQSQSQTASAFQTSSLSPSSHSQSFTPLYNSSTSASSTTASFNPPLNNSDSSTLDSKTKNTDAEVSGAAVSSTNPEEESDPGFLEEPDLENLYGPD